MKKDFSVSYYEFPYNGVELTCCIVADMHNYQGKKVAQKIQELKPDLIIILGDFIETPPRRKNTSCEEGILFLDELGHDFPIVYVRGNHDIQTPNELQMALSKYNVQVLDNSETEFHGIHFGGIPSFQYGGYDMSFPLSFSQMDGFKVLLCHHPEYYKDLKDLPVDIILSGHAHGGQWRIGNRGVFSPGQGVFPRYTKGFYDHKLLVSSGLAPEKVIPRIHNPRELVILKFKNNH